MTDELILDHRSKSYPLGAAPCRAADIGWRTTWPIRWP